MSMQRDLGEHGPMIVAGIGSATLSAVALLPRPLVNNDGIVYLAAADAFAGGGFEAARAIHGWPFFSILIAGVAAVLYRQASAAMVDRMEQDLVVDHTPAQRDFGYAPRAFAYPDGAVVAAPP